MRLFANGDRRQGDRRCDPTEQGGRRWVQRRKYERRRFFRVYYPAGASPRVLNRDLHVINISQEGIALGCRRPCRDCSSPVVPGEPLSLRLEFHDGEILDIDVRIMRCQGDLRSHETCYAGIIEQGICGQRIAKEQAYLLRLFPDFARASASSPDTATAKPS